MMKSRNIRQLMLPIIISGWVTGRGVIEYPIGKRWAVPSYIYSAMLIAGYLVLIIGTINDISSIIPASCVLGLWTLYAVMYTNIIVFVSNSLIGWKSIKGLKNIINRLERYDKKKSKIIISQDYRMIYRRQVITLIIEIFIVVVVILKDAIFKSMNFQALWHAVAMYFPFTLIAIGDATFIALVRLGCCFVLCYSANGLRFKQLNESLKEMSTTSDNSPQHKRVLEYTMLKRLDVDYDETKRTNDDPKAMRTALKDHYELVMIGDLIDETFGTQALLSVTVSFVCLLLILLRSTALFMWSSLNETFIYEALVSSCCWVMFLSYKIISTAMTCAQTSDECKETAVVISQLHEPSTRRAFRNQIRAFSLQMTHNTVQFTACGLFSLDNSLLYGMAGAILTFVIILVQTGEATAPTC